MIHVRHGVELGRIEGHYDEYGRVIEEEGTEEEKRFRGNHDGINGHKEICISEFDLADSRYRILQRKIYNDSECTFEDYMFELLMEELGKHDDVRKSELYNSISDEFKRQIEDLYVNEEDELKRKSKAEMLFSFGVRAMDYNKREKFYKEFSNLPPAKRDKYSGIVVWHSKCYHAATEEQKNDLTPSFSDPNQSWGKIRKKYQ